jgi:hypothetical protein
LPQRASPAATRTGREAIPWGTYTAPIDYEADFDLLHELDDDTVIVTVVLLRLQRRESERADCLEFIRANWHERSADGGVGQRFCLATGYPAAPRKPDDREGNCSANCAKGSWLHRSSHLLGDFHDFHLRLLGFAVALLPELSTVALCRNDMIADPKRKPHQDDCHRAKRRRQEMALDDALKNTFPASDPVSVEQPTPHAADRDSLKDNP